VQLQHRPAHASTSEAVQSPKPQKTYPREETALLELLVHHYHEVHPLVQEFLPPYLLSDPTCKKLVDILMLDPPETLTDGFHEYDEETQKVIARVQVEESRSIDAEMTAVELVQQYILIFWKRYIEYEQAALAQRTELSNEQRFKETTRLRHDLHALAKGWDNARPMLEMRLHSDVDF
jgi:DNA primase